MDEKLYKATMEGNKETLVNLIQQDPLILDRTNTITKTHLETPLHIAATLGHEAFAVELLKRKPGLARELDSRRSSALHLSSAKGHVAIVKALLQVNPDACLVCDRDGRNPVHVAAVMGRIDVLKELVAVRPAAARAVVKDGGTVLHLCVEYCQFEALNIVMESVDFGELVNSKDRYGNTVLHLAVADKQVQTTEFLLSVPKMDFNAVNFNGMTAMDILIQRRRDVRDLEMEETLKRAGTISTPLIFQYRNNHNPDHRRHKKKNVQTTNQDEWLDKKRSALMVVASLIATMAFQVGVNPPPNVWVDSQSSNSTAAYDSHMPLYYVQKASNFLKKDERFYIINTLSFVASLSIILLLMSGLPIKSRFFVFILLVITWIAISGIALSYTVAVILLAPPAEEKPINLIVGVTVFAWICVMGVLLLGHGFRLIVKVAKMVLKIVKIIVRFFFCVRRPAVRMNNSRV